MKRWIISAFIIILCACQINTLTVPITVTPSVSLHPPEVTPTPVPDRDTGKQFPNIQLAWEKSPHAVQSQNDALNTDGAWLVSRCDNCHENKGGMVGTTIARWNPEIQAHEFVPDSNTPCQKYHSDFSASIHQDISNSLAHQGIRCIDCHEPHSTANIKLKIITGLNIRSS